MMSEHPDASELVRAVREHLEGAVLPKLTGGDVFHLRVALHALGIVERELQEGPLLAAADRVELIALLESLGDVASVDPEAALLEGLRSGALDVSTPCLLDYLEARTLRRLAVDSPRYRHEFNS